MQIDYRLGHRFRILSIMIKRRIDSAISSRNLGDITLMHGWIARYLVGREGEDVFQKDIEENLSIRRSTATRMLQLMEKNGFIKRSSVAEDGRLKKIVPTEELHAIVAALQEELHNLELLMRKGISPEELDQFLKTMDKIEQNLTENQ